MTDRTAGSSLPPAGRTTLAGVVVALDGPSGSGKSSTARGVARRLGLRYLDTGAMYRAMTWWLLDRGIDVSDPTVVAAHADRPVMTVGTDPAEPTIVVDGVDVSAPIRGPAVTAAVSYVSAVPAVRARMVDVQRALIGTGGVVVEGRDIGTVVAPEAAVKVFLVASPDARARRRHAEGGRGSVTDTGTALRRRDEMDSARVLSPLSQAGDATVVDSTEHSLDEVVEIVVDLVERAVGTGHDEPEPR
jgi:cytidylate kinase